ncbi:MAG: FAD-binding oxidoreductase [Deltaproteobacteria bacterium]|nr:FAD-binding oxidoreductase [Deltaproteobacteria bacterium]
MSQLEAATSAFKALVGSDYVITQACALAAYETATFYTDQRVPVVVLPASTEEVRGVVHIANRYKIPIYPVSRGCNWGLGSRVPVSTDNCIVDLKRMNAIVDFDEQLGYITVEPGVSFRQVAEFLQNENSKLFLAMIGGPADSSLIGNALERGDAVGPLGEKAKYCCGIEAVLPTGEVINSGNEAFDNSLTRRLSKYGLGPDLDALFYQSNFAIVTRMTFWLAQKPEHFQVAVFGVRNKEELHRVTVSMRRLQQQGVIKEASYVLWNIYRFFSAQFQYPWDEGGKLKSSPDKLLEHLPRVWRDIRWIGIVGLYSASAAHARADKKMVLKALKGKTSRLFVIDLLKARFAHALAGPLNKITGMNITNAINTLYFNSVFLGHPQRVTAMYWRKRMAIPSDLDPNRDGCGLYWICVSLPFDCASITRLAEIVEEGSLRHNLEPQYMFWAANPWSLKSFIIIMYDREIDGEDQNAFNCYNLLCAQLHHAGFTPNRLGIQSMKSVAPDQQPYIDFIQRMKRLLDPNDILAPGRYDFRHRWRL